MNELQVLRVLSMGVSNLTLRLYVLIVCILCNQYLVFGTLLGANVGVVFLSKDDYECIYLSSNQGQSPRKKNKGIPKAIQTLYMWPSNKQ